MGRWLGLGQLVLADRRRYGEELRVPLVPAALGQRESLRRRTERFVEAMARLSIEAEVVYGDPLPDVAVSEMWDPARYDELVVSTLPAPVSTWLRIGLAQRIARLTSSPVHHVVASPRLLDASY
jgi:hypothetical protein